MINKRKKLAALYHRWFRFDHRTDTIGVHVNDSPEAVIAFLCAMGLVENTTDSVIKKRWHKLKHKR